MTSAKFYQEKKEKWVEVLVQLDSPNVMLDNCEAKLSLFYPKLNLSATELLIGNLKFVISLIEANQSVVKLYLNHRIQLGLEPLKIAFKSESEQISWFNLIQSAMLKCRPERKSLTGAQSPSFIYGCVGTIWAIFDGGQIYASDIHDINCSAELHECRWRKFEGHLVAVESQPKGITWGLGENGSAWAFADFKMQMNWSRTQVDIVVEKVYEFQRWSTFRGFISFTGKLQGLYYAWADESGLIRKTKETCRYCANQLSGNLISLILILDFRVLIGSGWTTGLST